MIFDEQIQHFNAKIADLVLQKKNVLKQYEFLIHW